MEVHHHAHTERKKWTHYFWEFLMLFLAVFCGFLAEYLLEHKIEKERGKQYIRSFYEDLVTDSSHFNNLISAYQVKLLVLQNLSPCYDSLKNGQAPVNCLGIILVHSMDFPDMVYADRTLQQLKNAGGLRLLKEADADSILFYDNQLRKYKIAETSGLQEVQSEIRNTYYTLFNYERWKDRRLNPNVSPLYGNNKDLLNKFFNQLNVYTAWCLARLNDLQELKKRNAELIDFFKKKNQFQ